MKTEVSSDKPIADAELSSVVRAVEVGLARFKDRLTRAEVHLKNLEGPRPTTGPECTLEVRPASRAPVAVSHTASTYSESVKGAVRKMERLLESTFGRSDSPRSRPSASGQPT